ncbi:MAG: hypothetical protein U5K75_03775 [Ahrensia sp.]|nr:hypothetical protein [Ahrensia sp.]
MEMLTTSLAPLVHHEIYSSFTALTALANAYVDLGTFNGYITPYVGAGIGGARVTWSNLSNTACETCEPDKLLSQQ